MLKKVKIDSDGWINLKLLKVGDSIGIVIPLQLLEKLKKQKGDNIKIKIKDFEHWY